MKKWVVEYYNGFDNVDFYVIAKDDIEAEELFLLRYKGRYTSFCINSIYEYNKYEPDFEDRESILKEI